MCLVTNIGTFSLLYLLILRMSKEAKEKPSLLVRPPNKFLKSDKLRAYLRGNKTFPVLHQKKNQIFQLNTSSRVSKLKASIYGIGY